MNTATTIIVAVLGSTALSALIQFFVSRHDKKAGIEDKLSKLEKDGLRTQLLLLLLLKPEEKQEILKLGEYYFGKLKGNWYLSSLFQKWCDNNGIEPEWFAKGE